MEQKQLLSIREASQLLGVSMATLRQWTDEGLIPAFVTPGGHRRYSPESIEEFIASHRNTRRIKDITAEMEGRLSDYHEMGRAFLEEQRLYDLLSPEAWQRLSHLGREIIRLAAEAVTTELEVGSGERSNEADRMGRELGKIFAMAGIPINVTLRLLLRERELLLDNLMRSIKAKGMRIQRLLGSLPVVNSLLDEIIASAVEEYSQSKEDAGSMLTQ